MDLRNNSRHVVVKSSGLNDTTAPVLMHSLFAPFSYSLLANVVNSSNKAKSKYESPCITTNCLEITVRDHSSRMDASLFARFNSYIVIIVYQSENQVINLNPIIPKAYLQIIVARNFCYFPPFVLYQCVNCQAVQWCFPYLVLATCMFGISSSNEHFIILYENTK